MAHREQRDFFLKVRSILPSLFSDVDVLDVGSLDLNGNNRYLFSARTYTGVDLGPGPNVDVVCKAHEYAPGRLYDVVISSECLEHDIHWKETVRNCASLTKPGGLLLISCATLGRPEHGTIRTQSVIDSPFTSAVWGEDYYRNLTEYDIRDCLDFPSAFPEHVFAADLTACDLYFAGIAQGGPSHLYSGALKRVLQQDPVHPPMPRDVRALIELSRQTTKMTFAFDPKTDGVILATFIAKNPAWTSRAVGSGAVEIRRR